MIRASVWTAATVIALAVAGCTEDNGVNTVQPDSITLDPTTLSLTVGETQNLNATFSLGGAPVTGVRGTWSTNNPKVVAINAGATNAAIIGIAGGTADVTLSAGTANATVHVTVTGGTPPPAAKPRVLDVAPDPIAVPLGGVVPVHVGAVFADGTEVEVSDQVMWTSNADTVATATGSSVTGLARGTANLTASYAGLTANVDVTVGEAAPHAMKITTVGGGTTFHVAVGATLQLDAAEVFTDKTELDVTTDAKTSWTSGTPANATINNTTSKGLVTGVVAGTSLITVTLNAPTSPVTLTTNITLTVDPAFN